VVSEFSSLKILGAACGEPRPVTLELHPTNRCNFNCPWCVDSVRRAGKEDLSLDVIKSVLTGFRNLGGLGVVWEGGGEPTVSSHFVDGIVFAKSIGLASGVTTNGSALYKPDVADAIVDCADWCRVSFDAWDIDSHSVSKGVSRKMSERVVDGMRSISKRFGNLGFSFVMCDDNYKFIGDAAVLARDLGCKYIQFKPMLFEGKTYWSPGSDFDGCLDRAYDVDGIDVHASRLSGKANSARFSECTAHEFVAHVDAAGDVWICCAYASLVGNLPHDKSDLVFGNVNEEEFEYIWKNRRGRISGLAKTSDFLSKCPKCRFGEYNEILGSIGREVRFL